MENDLISRSALKKAIAEYCKDYQGFGGIVDIIDNAPTVYDNPYSDGREDGYIEGYEEAKRERERPQGEWIVTAEDNDGVHRICCPFCHYEKGSNNTDTIIVTFTDFPKFCENCGADMKGGAE